jgi:hypothetical protein
VAGTAVDAPSTGPLHGPVDALTAALDAAIAGGPEACADGGSVEALHRQLARFESFVTEVAAAFDAAGEWSADGARTAASWLSSRCRVPRPVARRRVRMGRKLRHLPECARAWREGRIGTAQAAALVGARGHRTEEALTRDESMLVEQATRLGFEDFARAVSYWTQLADPEGADADEVERRDRRRVFLESSLDGMWLGQMTLDPISGAIVSGELERLERELLESDSAEAKERLGRRPRLDELARTAGQRRADALVEMATRSRTAPADGVRPAPLFSVFVGYETLHGRICELENGTVIAPGATDRWVDSAYFERAIFRLGNRIDVSVRARLFTGGTRRAIELRDRMCTHPTCYEPAEYCEGDHIQPWSEGGPTTQENGRLLCGFHNRLRKQANRVRPPPARPAA